MWIYKKIDKSLDLLGVILDVKVDTICKCYVLSKDISTVNLPTLNEEIALRLFGLQDQMKIGNVLTYYPQNDILNNVVIKYQVTLSEKALVSSRFLELYKQIKEDIELLNNFDKVYGVYLHSLVKSKLAREDKLQRVKNSFDNMEGNNEDKS